MASALFLVKVIGHELILAIKFPSLAAWRKANWHFWVVQRGPAGTIGAPMGSHWGQGSPKGTSRWFMWAQGGLLGHPGEPREAHPAAKGRQRGAKGRHGTTKTGQRWAKGSKNGPSRAPRRHQNESKMDLFMVKTQNVKTSKKHCFSPSKWIGNQPRTCQKRSQRAPGRPSGGTESFNGRPDDRSGHGQGPSGRSGGRPAPRAGPW